MKRSASAEWKGDLKTGKGTVSTQSGVLSNTQYSFSTRFEDGAGTNPEELIAAAHAGCFAMALSSAAVTLEKTAAGWTVTESHLDLKASIPNADRAKFDEAANAAKEGCPISKLLNAKITLNAELL